MDGRKGESLAGQVPGPVWRVKGDPLVRGSGSGPLAGTRVAVKDLYAVAGQRIGAGNPDWLAEAPVQERNAWAVQALLDAGADITGITQTDELAFSLNGTNKHYGTPPNPAAPGRITGGSSNGSASAVALGVVDLGLGTDTAGSVRVPASHCRLFGLRPTHGVVSTEGLQPLASSFDTVGWFARDAGLLRRAGDVLLPPAEVEPVRTFLIAEDVLELAEPATRATFEEAARTLAERRAGKVRRVESLLGGRVETWFAAFRAVQAAQAWAEHGAWIEAHPGSLGEGVMARFALGRDLDPRDRETSEALLDEARGVLYAALEPGTVLLLPAATAPAPLVGLERAAMEEYRFRTLRLTSLSSIAGLPAVVMPMAPVDALPVGLCAVGPRGTDRTLLDLAASFADGGAASPEA
ncbi:amidase [Actinomadura sp. NBRC 104412]|uniref:amidase n=1 Tax=Actinomadura sp. NBRC 104412 TaxID=3032203 RepID=UPI0024A03230|nr:amidase [Actinomadura sp. NBRC 104412]GLZ07765.1 amidase [Actinomadura sp. NBRC 104412]